MPTNSQRDDIVGAIGVMVLLIETATGNAYVMLGLSLTAFIALTVFYGQKIGRGSILVALAAAGTAAVIGIVVALR